MIASHPGSRRPRSSSRGHADGAEASPPGADADLVDDARPQVLDQAGAALLAALAGVVDDPRQPAMSEKPTLTDFFKHGS